MPIDYFIANKLNHDHGGPLRVIGISNSTRSQIVSELRKSGTLSVNELTERVGISSMGIRQHLAYLEKNGLTSQEQRRQPLGRPCAYYRLTEAAEALFPKLYAHFAAGILNDISEHEGKDKLELIFKWRCQRNWNKFSAFTNQPKLVDRANALVKAMDDIGISCNFTLKNNVLTFVTFNCLVYKLAKVYPQFCRYDRELMRSLLNVDFELTQSLVDGDKCCELTAVNAGN